MKELGLDPDPGRRTASARDAEPRADRAAPPMELLDAEGVAGLSMRKLGREAAAPAPPASTGTSRPRTTCSTLLIDEIWGEIDVPEPETGGLAGRGDAVRPQPALGRPPAPVAARGHVHPAEHGPERVDAGLPRPGAVRRGRVLRPRGRLRDGQRDVLRARHPSAEVAWRSMVKAVGQDSDRVERPGAGPGAVGGRGLPRHPRHARTPRRTDPYERLDASFTFGLECLLDGFAARL